MSGTPFDVLICCALVVADLEHGPGVETSAGSDVFVCEAAVDTPAQESDAVSVLPGEASWRGFPAFADPTWSGSSEIGALSRPQ